MKRRAQFLTVVLATASILGFARFGHAALSAVSTQFAPPQFALDGVGNSTGFPRWYQDSTGQALELCLAPTPSPNVAPPDPTALMCIVLETPLLFPDNPLVFPSNFPPEAFWFLADAGLDVAPPPGQTTGRALYRAAIEAAFANGAVAAGDQVSFARIRIRVDVPDPGGTFVVTHPYGVETFPNVAPGIRAINFTSDIGLFPPPPTNFNGALNGAIGPFLNRAVAGVATPYIVAGAGGPETYIGDPNLLEPVVGSPFGTNFVRIEGPNIGGPGVDFVETDLFNLMGKVFTDPLPSPLTLERATYSRTADGLVDLSVFASSSATATVGVTGAGIPLNATLNGSAGKFFGMFLDLAAVPSPITVTATDGANAPTSLPTTPADVVFITKAEFNMTTDQLTIEASSSDAGAPPVTLTAVGFGPLTVAGGVGSLVVNILSGIPPASVTVTSAAGGVDSHLTTVIPEDVLTISSASFTTRGGTWSINGSGSVPGNTITVRLGANVIGTATVSPTKAWRVAVRNSLAIPAPGSAVTAVSSQGGQATATARIR